MANGEWKADFFTTRHSLFAIRALHRHIEETSTMHRCAIIDDYQNVALKLADWGQLKGEVDVRVYNESLGDQANVIRTLKDCSIVCLMRERTLFPRAVFE